MRLIDADALADDVMDRYCKDCDNRKGIKDGKYRIIYEIGEAPCRVCEVDDMFYELENAPTVDAVEVVRCKECKHYYADPWGWGNCVFEGGVSRRTKTIDCCSWGERKDEVT